VIELHYLFWDLFLGFLISGAATAVGAGQGQSPKKASLHNYFYWAVVGKNGG